MTGPGGTAGKTKNWLSYRRFVIFDTVNDCETVDNGRNIAVIPVSRDC
jgi:hypothetical protein